MAGGARTLLVVVLLVIASSGGAQGIGTPPARSAAVEWADPGYVWAVGDGCGRPEAPAGLRRSNARRAAIAVAQARLLDAVRALSLYAGVGLGQAMEASETVTTSVLGVLRGATVVDGSEAWDGERCVRLTMVVLLDDLRREVPQLPTVRTAAPAAPIAFDDRSRVERGSEARIDVLSNDHDPDGDALTPRIVTPPQHGRLAVHADGSLSYRHDGGAATADGFVYRADDGTRTSDGAVVRVAVTVPDESPRGPPDALLQDAAAEAPVRDTAAETEHGRTDHPDRAAEVGVAPSEPEPPAVASGGPQPTEPEAGPLVEKATRAMLAALSGQAVASPDDPMWSETIALALRARERAPDDARIVHLLARIHAHVGWHSRSWEYWLSYLESGGAPDDLEPAGPEEPPASVLFADAGTALGFAHYRAGRPDEALEHYERVLEWLPDDVEALTWAARIHFEAGRSADSLPYWERAAAAAPDDDSVRRFLERTRERLVVGVEASDAYRAGLAAHERGELEEALARFEVALEAHPSFAEAAVWAGRTSGELGLAERAHGHWIRVVELDPTDERAAYFADLTQAQATWGIAAADAFAAGQQHYARGEVALAAERFATATVINADYLLAWEWAARAHQEAGRYDDAIVYWQGVVARDPANDRAAHALAVAEQQVGHGPEAGRALAAAVAAYTAVDFASAEAHLEAAITADPDFAEAWAWLGRLHFTLAEYGEAAEDYGQAADLDPDNGDYRFFAEEAARLASQL